jgi:hypothetical protein
MWAGGLSEEKIRSTKKTAPPLPSPATKYEKTTQKLFKNIVNTVL